MKRDQIQRLEDLPNIGPAIASDFCRIGIATPSDLRGQDPYRLYDRLNQSTGVRHDPCVLDTFIAAVRYMDGGPKKPWWAFTAERKREMAKREKPGRSQQPR